MLSNKQQSIIASIFLMTLASCGSKPSANQQAVAPPAVAISLDTVQFTTANYHDEYPGSVVALEQVELRAQVSGYITGIYFKDGDQVKKGQKLYTIDAQVYNANYEQALANVQVQETNLMKAQRDADRYHELDKQDAIAKQQVDYADAALAAAKKQVEAAKAALNSVRSSVNFATIYAPFSGTIGISQVRLGTAVVAGQTVLNTVSTNDPVAVDFNVNQQELYRFGQLLEKPGKDSTFTIAFGKEVYPYPGKISLIDRAVDPQTGTIRTRLSFPNNKGLLKPGMTTLVRVLNQTGDTAVVIPYKAVTEQLGEFFVYVISDSSTAQQRKVVLGKTMGTGVLIKQGLTAGEKIAIQGVQNLREGAKVAIAPAQ
jgi:membrane fusion protein (multidrug efflux system)